jgi:hypothetical protein
MMEATKLEEHEGQILRRQGSSKGKKRGKRRKQPKNENAERRVKLRSWRRRQKDILTRWPLVREK